MESAKMKKHVDSFLYKIFLWFLITKLLQVSGSDDDNLMKLWHIRHALKTKAMLGVQIWEGVRGPADFLLSEGEGKK